MAKTKENANFFALAFVFAPDKVLMLSYSESSVFRLPASSTISSVLS